MSGDGRYLGPSAGVPELRPCWVMRFLEEQTRHQTLPPERTSHRAVVRAGRGLALVLCRRNFPRLAVRLAASRVHIGSFFQTEPGAGYRGHLSTSGADHSLASTLGPGIRSGIG